MQRHWASQRRQGLHQGERPFASSGAREWSTRVEHESGVKTYRGRTHRVTRLDIRAAHVCADFAEPGDREVLHQPGGLLCRPPRRRVCRVEVDRPEHVHELGEFIRPTALPRETVSLQLQ